ncbi:MAG: archaeosortase/exosortase family protein [Dehalococcoidia bacterium]
MAKKHKKGAVPRPKGRGTVHKGQRRSAGAQFAPLEAIKLGLRRHRAVVKGGLIFAGGILVFMLIYSRIAETEALAGFLTFNARATGAILNIFGASVQVDGTLISSPDYSMRIVTECTALVPMAIVVCAVLAYPCTAKQKAIGAALGIVGLFILNLVRTVSLFFIGGHFSTNFFNTAHFLIWQPVMIVLAIVLWLFWAEKIARVTPH